MSEALSGPAKAQSQTFSATSRTTPASRTPKSTFVSRYDVLCRRSVGSPSGPVGRSHRASIHTSSQARMAWNASAIRNRKSNRRERRGEIRGSSATREGSQPTDTIQGSVWSGKSTRAAIPVATNDFVRPRRSMSCPTMPYDGPGSAQS